MTTGRSAARHLLIALVGLGGFAFGLVAEAQQLGFDDRPLAWLTADLVGGWAFMAAGLIAWDRRPANRMGPLLVAIGFAWFVGTFGRSSSITVAYLGGGLQGFYEPLLAIAVLAYPTGRLVDRASRVLAGAWLLDHGIWATARLALNRPLDWYGCSTCPDTIDRYVGDRTVLPQVGSVTLAVSVVLAGLVLAVVVRRLRQARPAGRRQLLPMALGAVAVLAVVGLSGLARLTIAPRLFAGPEAGIAYDLLAMLVAVAMLAGLLRERLARSAVADLLVALRATVPGDVAGVQTAVRGALGDPTAQYLAREVDGTFRDAEGAAVPAPEASPWLATSVIGPADDPAGVILHDAALLAEPELVQAVSVAVAVESENARLGAEVRRQLDEVSASRLRIVQAADRERRRVERDLHDGAQQRLVALALEVGRLRSQARTAGSDDLAAALDGLSGDLDAAIADLRELARGILPPILAEAGLAAAIESLALRAPLPTKVDVKVGGRMAPDIESTAYFVVAEALTNIARHASARHASVTGRVAGGRLRIVVEDDGVGGADPARGTGISGLLDRVGALGGRLAVEPADGSGTRLVAELPLP